MDWRRGSVGARISGTAYVGAPSVRSTAYWIAWATALVATLSVAPAAAHPPYEREDLSVLDSVGREVRFVKCYVDGIFSTDPVKMVVRDRSGKTYGQTAFGRDVSVVC